MPAPDFTYRGYSPRENVVFMLVHIFAAFCCVLLGPAIIWAGYLWLWNICAVILTLCFVLRAFPHPAEWRLKTRLAVCVVIGVMIFYSVYNPLETSVLWGFVFLYILVFDMPDRSVGPLLFFFITSQWGANREWDDMILDEVAIIIAGFYYVQLAVQHLAKISSEVVFCLTALIYGAVVMFFVNYDCSLSFAEILRKTYLE